MVETIYRIPGIPGVPGVPGISGIPSLPRIALLTDLHGRDPAPVLTSLRSRAPSLIAIAGDILYGSQPVNDRSPLDTQENVLPFLESCAALAPTFLSLGNHEWMLDSTDLERIRSTGVVVLDNDYQTITLENQKIILAGLTSGYVMDYRRFLATLDEQERAEVRYPREHTIIGIRGAVSAFQHHPETAWLQAFSSTPGFHLLLSHHPEYFPLVPTTVDLVLSDHAHGGQWRVFNHGVFAPGQGFWPKWTRGVYERNRLVVSAGLSNTAKVPRLFNPCEVVYIEPE